MYLKNLALVIAMLALLGATSPAMAGKSSQKSAKIASKSKSRTHAKTTHAKAKGRARRRGRVRRTSWKRRGQQRIEPGRAREIQEALIRDKYLSGTPSGPWDTHPPAAMARYQADHGWQRKEVPDSRALIKLGLGPDYSQNAISFNTTGGSDSTSVAGASNSDSPMHRQ